MEEDASTLYDFYNRIIANHIRWDYYGLGNCQIYSVNDIEDGDKCRAFLRTLLAESGKEETYLSKSIAQLSDDRLCHIVSVYFFGFLLYEQCDFIKQNVNKQLKWLKKNHCANSARESESSEEKFSYLWFLVCIFHDLGYIFEQNCYPDCNWQQRITSRIPGRRPKGIPAYYTKDLLEKYASFRQCRYNCFDHGIYGAKVFYADLCKIREDNDKHQDSQRYWGKELIQYFNLASWLIACHNVFYVKCNDVNAQCYKYYGLDSLIYHDRSRKIILRKHSLFFLLCLVDSIDLMKSAYISVSDWEKIKIHFTDNQIILNFSELPSAKLSMITDLNFWLTDISHENGIIKIKIA